jgi:hypothetical protein
MITTEFGKDCFGNITGVPPTEVVIRSWNRGEFAAKTAIGLGAM